MMAATSSCAQTTLCCLQGYPEGGFFICCERGLESVDLSAGEAPYKRQWADETIELSTILRAVNPAGLAWTIAAAIHLAVKRAIKRAPALLLGWTMLRRFFLGTPAKKRFDGRSTEHRLPGPPNAIAGGGKGPTAPAVG